jgi:hypothetical protein
MCAPGSRPINAVLAEPPGLAGLGHTIPLLDRHCEAMDIAAADELVTA